VGAQYYWIFHYHPVALLGYIGLLEGYPPTIDTIDELMMSTGYSAKAFRTLRKHAELDPGHGEELDAVLDTLPLTKEHMVVMGLSAMYSVDMLRCAYDEILDLSAA
jgi:hypothetical protein